MKTLDIEVVIVKDNKKIKRQTKTFNVDESLNVSHVKDIFKNELNFPFEIVKEEFYYMSSELKDADTLPIKSGNKFYLIIK